MKNILVCFLITILSTISFSQKLNPAQPLLKEDYLLKSKNQKKVGWILLGGGATLIAASKLIPRGEVTGSEPYPWLPIIDIETYENDNLKAALGFTGLVSMLGSIPFFITSGKNKRKANTALNASLYFRFEKDQILNTYNIGTERITSIGIRLNY